MWTCAQSIPVELKYLDAKKPLEKPLIFAQGIISNDSLSEFGSVFNKEGSEFFYAIDDGGKAYIKSTKLQGGTWSKPTTILTDTEYSYNDPCLSPEEDRLYYISDRPRDDQDKNRDYDIWYSKKTTSGGWTAPINAGPSINSNANEYYISFSETGTLYFASNRENAPNRNRDFDIYKSELKDNSFQEPKKLKAPLNTKSYEADAFIAPDESYIIFCSTKKEGFGRGDLYINFKDKNGNWTQSINMGSSINSASHELCPFVTKDGKYFFYTSDQDIYWVSTSIFDKLRSQ